MELDVQLAADGPQTTARFDWLAVNFTDPLADQVVGEIYPLEVIPGQPTQFSYFLRPAQSPTGFDQIAIESSTTPRFDAALLDGEPVEVATETTDQGFRATFARRIRSRQLVELRFTSPVYLQATRFDAFLQDSNQAQTRQLVAPGDAAPLVESSSNVVRIPVAATLFSNLVFTSTLITPNGDGINDDLAISFDLINVLSARPLRLQLYDLAGRQIYAVEQPAAAGRQVLRWAGRDAAGSQVPPGLYLAEVHISGDAGDRSVRRTVSVAY